MLVSLRITMAAMVKRLSHWFVVPVLRVRFPLAAPARNSTRHLFATGVDYVGFFV